MKAARIVSVVFGILGLVLMLGTALVCFSALDAPVRAEIPQAVKDCGTEVAQLLNQGELKAVEEKLYGNPSLGADRTLTGESAAVWALFCSGISCELSSDVYVSGSSYAVDAVITVPDIASMTDTVGSHARILLDERIAAAEKMAELYDETGDYRQDVIDAVMMQAVERALAEEPEQLTFETTFTFVYQTMQWSVVPDTAFMQALRGGL